MPLTHEIKIQYNGADPKVLSWLQKISSQARHPQYAEGIKVKPPVVVEAPPEVC